MAAENRTVNMTPGEAQIMGIIPPRKPGELPSKAQRIRARNAAAKKKKHDKRRKGT